MTPGLFRCCRHCDPTSPFHPRFANVHTDACGCDECPYPDDDAPPTLW